MMFPVFPSAGVGLGAGMGMPLGAGMSNGMGLGLPQAAKRGGKHTPTLPILGCKHKRLLI